MPALELAAWAGVLMSFMLTLLGPSFNQPDWALGISPFWHVPVVTQSRPDWSGLLWVSLFAPASSSLVSPASGGATSPPRRR